MSVLERDLEAMLCSIEHDAPVPTQLFDRVVTRRRRRRRGTALSVVAAAAAVFVVIGFVPFTSVTTRPGHVTASYGSPIGVGSLHWHDGRITVNHKVDDAVSGSSVLGMLDGHHAVVDPLGGEESSTYRLLVVDLRTGKARTVATLPGRDREGGEAYTGHSYLYIASGAIRALDVVSGRTTTLARGVRPLTLVAGDGMVAWRSVDGDTYVRPLRDGRAVRIDEAGGEDRLSFGDSRLVAYDGFMLRLIDPRTGEVLERVRVEQDPALTDTFATTCGSRFCVSGEPAGSQPTGDGPGPVRMWLSPLTGGGARSVPGDPVVRPYRSRDSIGFLGGARVHRDYLVWSSASHGTRITSYLYDTRGHHVIRLGRGLAYVTDDGWLVVTPTLGPEGEQSGASADLRVRIARLP